MKSDDAGVPFYLWEDAIKSQVSCPSHNKGYFFNYLRLRMLRWWKRNIFRSLRIYLDKMWGKDRGADKSIRWMPNLNKYIWVCQNAYDLFARRLKPSVKHVLRDILTRTSHTSWWFWDLGSRLIFGGGLVNYNLILYSVRHH